MCAISTRRFGAPRFTIAHSLGSDARHRQFGATCSSGWPSGHEANLAGWSVREKCGAQSHSPESAARPSRSAVVARPVREQPVDEKYQSSQCGKDEPETRRTIYGPWSIKPATAMHPRSRCAIRQIWRVSCPARRRGRRCDPTTRLTSSQCRPGARWSPRRRRWQPRRSRSSRSQSTTMISSRDSDSGRSV